MITQVSFRKQNARWWWLWYVLVSGLFLGLIGYAANGVRGSDQYWNLGNVERLIAGGERFTNCVYPGPILRGDYTLSENYFIHHTLALYVAAFIGQFTGAYHGWILMNVLATLGCAALIALVLQRLAGSFWAAMGFASYLFLPLTIWQTANVLHEAVYSLLAVALAAGVILLGKPWWQWLLVSLLGCVALYVHPIFMPVSMAAPLTYLWLNRSRLAPIRILGALGLVALLLACYATRDALLPSTLPQGLSGIIRGVIPGEGNIEWHLRKTLPDITVSLMLLKLLDAVKKQFAINASAIFIWPVNLLILFSVIGVVLRRRQADIQRLGGMLLLLVGGFCFVLWMHQNQFRYGLFVAGIGVIGSLVALAHFTEHSRRLRLFPKLLVCGLLGLLVIDFVVARDLRHDAQREAQIVKQIRAATNQLPTDRAVVIDATSSSYPLLLSYALRPRRCLIISSAALSDAELAEILALIKPVAAFTEPGSSRLPGTSDATHGKEFDGGKYSDMRLFPWSENESAAQPQHADP